MFAEKIIAKLDDNRLGFFRTIFLIISCVALTRVWKVFSQQQKFPFFNCPDAIADKVCALPFDTIKNFNFGVVVPRVIPGNIVSLYDDGIFQRWNNFEQMRLLGKLPYHISYLNTFDEPSLNICKNSI